MKNIYCISGFGADERVFSRIEFSGYEVHYVQWIIPEKTESIKNYATRMIEQINHVNPILLGLSFGGIMCIEIAKQIPVEMVLLISSIKSSAELPYWMRLSGKLRLDKIFPLKSFRIFEPVQNYNLGLENKEEKKLVRNYRKNINQQYTNWAINAILNWQNNWQPENLFHIHGDKDRIFPIKKVKPNFIINGAGHFLIMNRASAVNKQINAILSKFSESLAEVNQKTSL